MAMKFHRKWRANKVETHKSPKFEWARGWHGLSLCFLLSLQQALPASCQFAHYFIHKAWILSLSQNEIATENLHPIQAHGRRGRQACNGNKGLGIVWEYSTLFCIAISTIMKHSTQVVLQASGIKIPKSLRRGPNQSVPEVNGWASLASKHL